MNITFEKLTHENYPQACMIDRVDIPESFVDTASTLMELTDYGMEHNCIGHTFLVKADNRCIGIILLGEAIPWDTDPPVVREKPFYRLMGFVIDRAYRGQGIGGEVLEKVIERVCHDFGERSLVLGCHKDNHRAAQFYERHGFMKTEYMEGNDYYFIRLL